MQQMHAQLPADKQKVLHAIINNHMKQIHTAKCDLRRDLNGVEGINCRQ